MVQARTALGGMHIHQVMLTDFHSLDVDDPLHHAVDLTLAGSQKDFPVVRDGVVAGVLTQSDLMRGLKERGEQAPVGTSMHTGCELAHPDETAQGVLMRLQSHDCHVLPVVLDGQLVGMVNLENVGEFLQIREALEA